MKKLMLLLLACFSMGLFAQESPGKADHIKNTPVTNDIAFLDHTKVASASPNLELLLNSNKLNNNFLPNLYTSDNSEYKAVVSEKFILENSNSMIREGMVAFSKDKKTVFFSVNRKIRNVKSVKGGVIETKRAVNLQLFKARVNENGEWVDLEMLPFNSSRYSTGQPFLNYDETKLYFVSDGPGSLGRTDIFFVDLNDDGTYGSPVNLGPKINSTEREIFPFINEENILYFSSDVQNKKGDLNIFASKLYDSTLSVPVMLDGSVPAGKSEYTYDIIENVDSNTFSSREITDKGVEEIYAHVDAVNVNFDCEQEVSGIVRNSNNDELLPNVKITLYDLNNEVLSSFMSDEIDATFSFKQTCNTVQTLKAHMEGYLVQEMTVKTVNDLNSDPLEIVMDLNLDHSEADALDTNKITAVDMVAIIDANDSKEKTSSEIENQDTQVNTDVNLRSSYNFDKDQEAFTVQIGAFEGTAETDKYDNINGLFNHVYDDGYNRYYSGVFNSRSEALVYLKQLKDIGYNDAYVIRLKGEKRF